MYIIPSNNTMMVEAISNNNVVGVVVVVYAQEKEAFLLQRAYLSSRSSTTDVVIVVVVVVTFFYRINMFAFYCFSRTIMQIYLCYINAVFVRVKSISTQCWNMSSYFHKNYKMWIPIDEHDCWLLIR